MEEYIYTWNYLLLYFICCIVDNDPEYVVESLPVNYMLLKKIIKYCTQAALQTKLCLASFDFAQNFPLL